MGIPDSSASVAVVQAGPFGSSGEIQNDSESALFWAWALFHSCSFALAIKLPGYVLPMFPALALLARKQWDRLWSLRSDEEFRRDNA
jgi:4-amino-4-deoxy-L-arabinose transferase-like glycosyltransferase